MRTGFVVGRTLAVVAGLVLATGASASAATIAVQPAAGDARTFTASQGGWTNSVDTGGVCVLPGVTCPIATPSFQASGGSGGAGDGHLRADVTTVLSLLSNVTIARVPFAAASATFAPLQLSVSPGALTPGHRYAIELRTSSTGRRRSHREAPSTSTTSRCSSRTCSRRRA